MIEEEEKKRRQLIKFINNLILLSIDIKKCIQIKHQIKISIYSRNSNNKEPTPTQDSQNSTNKLINSTYNNLKCYNYSHHNFSNNFHSNHLHLHFNKDFSTFKIHQIYNYL